MTKIDVNNYQTQITAVVTAVLSQRRSIEGSNAKIYDAITANLGPLTVDEFGAVRKVIGVTLKEHGFKPATVDTMFSVVAKLKAHGKALPESWGKARTEYEAVVKAEKAAGTGDKRGAKQKIASTEADADADGTSTEAKVLEKLLEKAKDADPVMALLVSFRPKISQLSKAIADGGNGIALERIENALLAVLVDLQAEAEDAADGIVVDDGDGVESETMEERETRLLAAMIDADEDEPVADLSDEIGTAAAEMVAQREAEAA